MHSAYTEKRTLQSHSLTVIVDAYTRGEIAAVGLLLSQFGIAVQLR